MIARRPAHTLPLGHGLELRCTMDELDDSVLVAIAFHRLVLWKQRFRKKNKHAHPTLSLPFLRAEVALETDVFEGVIMGTVQIAVRPLFGRWRSLVDREDDILVRFDPAVGEIGGSIDIVEPKVDSVQFGRSRLCNPAILRIHVDNDKREISDVGRLVKQTLFPKHPPFVFNTIACVGEFEARGRGAYPNPNSRWFNVFFGFYEIDVSKEKWGRPFGYKSADGRDSEIEIDDVARLGKADWNFFSNWMYGVPDAAIAPYNGLGGVKGEPAEELVTIGNTDWHAATVTGVECVSTYESNARAAAKLVQNSVIDDVWRASFGPPNPQPGKDQSFVPTTVRADLFMSYRDEGDAYRTLIGGGTDKEPVDEQFIGEQLAAIRAAMERAYADAGFPPPGP